MKISILIIFVILFAVLIVLGYKKSKKVTDSRTGGGRDEDAPHQN